MVEKKYKTSRLDNSCRLYRVIWISGETFLGGNLKPPIGNKKKKRALHIFIV
jgi:hypothetical protein